MKTKKKQKNLSHSDLLIVLVELEPIPRSKFPTPWRWRSTSCISSKVQGHREKLFRVVVIKGSQHGVQLESSVRDRLVAVDEYEDGEEEALDKVTEFFQSKYSSVQVIA
jgi:hypothetical protein